MTGPKPLPLSYAQQRLWMLDRLHGGGAPYSAPLALRLHGQVDVAALTASLADLVGRHESLRTVFPVTDEVPHQQVLELRPGQPGLVVLAADEETVIDDLVRVASEPFDLASELPIRARLFVLSDHESVLLLVLHHIVCDGWSLAPLLRDLAHAYEARCQNREPCWAPLPVQYGDYTMWQHEILGSEDDPDSLISAELDYWRCALAGLAPELPLPSDHPRPVLPTHRGALVPFQLDVQLAQGLRTLASAHHSTVFMVLQAAVLALLHRWGAGSDLVVGTPVAGRTDEAMEDLVGFFVNTLVLRTDVSGDPSFAELLRRVRETDLAAYAHQDLPFERLVEVLNPPRSLSRHPLFQVNLVLQSNAPAELSLHGLRVSTAPVRIDLAKFDLTFAFIEKLDADGVPGGIDANIEYAVDLYDQATAQALAHALVQVLSAAAADPDRSLSSIPLLSPAERAQLVEEWNAGETAPPSGCVPELITDRLRAAPDAVVVRFGTAELTGRQLDQRTAQLAHRLRALGVGPGTRVGLCLQRSVELVIAVVAVLRAGGAYLPLEPTYPTERLALMITDAELPVVVTHGPVRDRVPAGPVVVDLDATAADLAGLPTELDGVEVGPDDPAYVIYTSGSTGRPKAVVNNHRGLANRLAWMQRQYRLDSSDVVLQKTPFSFDVSVWEFCWPLLTGAALVVARPDGHKDPAYLAELIRAEGVTTLHFVPSMLEVFSEVTALESLPSLRRIICSGEALPAALAQRVLAAAPWCGVHNLYGPTEAAIDVCHWTCGPDDPAAAHVPIGRPVDNTQLYVLDDQLEPVPPGVAGELCIGGVQLADGYLRRPGLTAERFVANRFHPGRMYRTGDLARWRHDGVLEFLGRLDHQIKLRGFRIELGEVEAALRAQHEVRDAVVVGRDGRLVGYVVAEPGPDPTATLRERLGRTLPEHLVPDVLVRLDALPLSANGKLDRAALPEPAAVATDDGHRVTARDGLELEIVGLWEDLLGIRPLGVTDDFFAHGGTSLLVIRMLGRLTRRYGVELPVSVMFTGGDATVERLAREIRRDPASRRWSSLVTIRPAATGADRARPPLFCLPAAVGNALSYVDLARLLPPEWPVYGLQAPGLDPGSTPVRTIDELADVFVDAIRGVQPAGPYHLVGYCAGSITALAVAERLRAAGEEVALLAAIDGGPPAPPAGPVVHAGEADTASWFAWELGVAADRELDIDPDDLRELTGEELAEAVLARAVAADVLPADTSTAALSRLLVTFDAFVRGVVDFRADPYDGPVVVFRATEEPCAREAVARWDSVATGEFMACDVPGDHYTLLRTPHVEVLAEAFSQTLDLVVAGGRVRGLATVGDDR